MGDGSLPPLLSSLLPPPTPRKKGGNFSLQEYIPRGNYLVLLCLDQALKKKEKKAKINSDGRFISVGSGVFAGIRGSFAGCWSLLPLLEVEIKNVG